MSVIGVRGEITVKESNANTVVWSGGRFWQDVIGPGQERLSVEL